MIKTNKLNRSKSCKNASSGNDGKEDINHSTRTKSVARQSNTPSPISFGSQKQGKTEEKGREKVTPECIKASNSHSQPLKVNLHSSFKFG